MLFVTSLLLVIVVFGISRFQITSDVALYAVALALAMIPESLLAIITITLARGVARMHERHAVIRRLDAIETIGGVGDICLDKSGTLTTGNMEVKKIWNGKRIIQYGLEDVGSIGDGDVEDLIRCASLCNNAILKKTGMQWQTSGESTEVTLSMYELI